MEYKVLVGSPNVVSFEMQELWEQGWRINPELPMASNFFNVEVGMHRKIGTGTNPTTPQERAAYARQVRADKAARK